MWVSAYNSKSFVGNYFLRYALVSCFEATIKGWRKTTEQCKDFLIGRKQKIRKNTQGKEQKMIVIEQLAVSNSTVLNQELNWGSTDWNKEAELIKSLLSQPIKCND